MTSIRLLFCLAVLVVGARASDLGSLRVIASADHYGPPSGLVEAAPRLFYSNGGSAGQVLFSMTAGGVSSKLADLPVGDYVQAPLVAAANGLFYSAAAHRLDPVSLFSIGAVAGSLWLYAPQTIDPMLTQNLPDGSLLGVAVTLSATPIYSLVRCGLDGKVSTLRQFPSGERLPHTAFLGSDGSYYGVSMLPDGAGYVYSLTPPDNFKKLLSFPSNSLHGNPVDVPLLEGDDANLYGATTSGGPQGAGTIYKLSPAGSYNQLYSFPRKDFSFSPTALIEASDGDLYGTTLEARASFFASLSPAGSRCCIRWICIRRAPARAGWSKPATAAFMAPRPWEAPSVWAAYSRGTEACPSRGLRRCDSSRHPRRPAPRS